MTIIELLICLFLTGLGVFGLIYQGRELVLALSSRRWATSEAVITNCAVHENRRRRRTSFEPRVEYKYTFREHEYVGQRLAFGGVSCPSREEAERIADRFAVGTRWEVSVNERRPTLAVLHPGPIRRLWVSIVFLTGFTGFAIGFLIDTLRKLNG